MQSLWMLAATFLFSLMAVCAKFVAAGTGTGEIVFYRGLTGALVLFLICRLRHMPLRTPHGMLHLKRNTVGLASMCLWFHTIVALPLATAMTLASTAPLWVAMSVLVGALRATGRLHDWRAALIPLAGFAGVVLLLQPTFERHLWSAGLLGVAGAVCGALAYLQVRVIAETGEPEWRIVFYFSAGNALVGLVWAIAEGMHWPTWRESALLLMVGLTSLGGQFALTRALARGNTLSAVTLQYTGVLFAALWGILIWDDMPTVVGWFSMALIMASGIASTWLSLHRVRAVPSANAGAQSA
jgi:S-adenosylmethionine uptake transporter